MIIFIGEIGIGIVIMKVVVDGMCGVFLELGGKNVVLVFGDVDMEKVVEGIICLVFFNCG